MTNNVLKTDLSRLMMMAAQYHKGIHNQVVTCEAFVNQLPAQKNFLIMVGTEEIRNFLANLHFSKDDIAQIKELKPLKSVFATSNFDKFLEDFSFTGDMWAMAEGEIAFSKEPLVKITSTLSEVHMIETFILSVLNHNISVATKAARMVLAARGRPILELGTRQVHHESAVNSARSAYLAGFSSTSNIEAAIRYKIPVANILPYIRVFTDKNEESDSTLFIDTYEILNGAKSLASKFSHLKGVMLDVRDSNRLLEVRELLNNENNGSNVKIVISGELDEYHIDKLSKSDDLIDSYIAEESLSILTDSNGLYDPLIVDYEIVYDDENDKPFHSLSCIPGRKQVFLDQRNNGWSHLLVAENVIQPSSELIPLLDCYIKNGEAQHENIVDLEVSRKYCNASLLNIPSKLTSLIKTLDPQLYIHESVEDLIINKGVINGYELVLGDWWNESL
jgi:nicotinate phosphoribosyltransferase